MDAAAAAAAAAAVARARNAYVGGATKPLEWRERQLRSLRRLLVDGADVLCDALAADLGKSRTEAMITEIGFTVNEIDHLLKHLRSWLRPERVSVPVTLPFARARVVREPLGVVLVIAPWNYPVQLALAPLAGAIAGGNAVVVKPSEVAAATSHALARLLREHLDPNAVQVVEGGVPETTALLAERFDHIFYTGNGTVGRIVLEAAAKHLTPVTLELGGKSPTYVDDSADLEVAARRIVLGKFTNAGQTCVAPDYVLATREVLDRLKPLLSKAIGDFFGDDPASSPDYGRIIDGRHFDRLCGLIEPSLVVSGGGTDARHRYIEPTVLDGVTREHGVMQEEIFGPVLPLVEVAGIDGAIDFINDRDRPLALYLFTADSSTRRRFERETSSGALGVNIPLAHLMVPDLPFGGVGPSGMGAYHGRASIETFTHAKGVLTHPTRVDTTALIYPPFAGLKRRLVETLMAPRRKR
ncbi:aldehyde dehydrogenase [Humibacillus sp. DSM 29435]|nr:aldehyde dehydrogenase family protein [Humibacillus sp. DSM 29435]OFE16834.1 aldehyde dehydrogenase [Humibacillus sp. DSM 29435]